MILAPVDYCRPASLDEALEALNSSPDARALAGGQSLINILKLRAASVDLLVDISRLEELRSIVRNDDGGLEVGAGVTYAELAESDLLAGDPTGIADVAANTVDPQVRHRGTIGGNVCHADPINNFPPLMVALGATMHVLGPNGAHRDVPAEEFFTGFFTTAVEDGELLEKITIPALPDGAGVGFVDLEIGEAAARAVAVVRTEDDQIADARLVIGCLPVPTRRPEVEEALAGTAVDEEAVRAATAAAAEGVEPLSDADATAEYRKAVIPVVAKRAVLAAAKGGHRE
jgi:carbon-monoxide dehydrogenase medium subunit